MIILNIKNISKIIGLFFLCCLGSYAFGQRGLKPTVRNKVAPPASKNQFELYLLIGQSNMAGRGYPEAIDTTADSRVLTLNKAGEWEEAKEPIHFDKPEAGVGPGLAFGKAMAAGNKNVTIGLIPCAVGGSAIEFWRAGIFYPATKVNAYDDAMARARIAMRYGTLKGIIWHQGESDSGPAQSAAYAANLTALINTLRKDLGIPDLPFIAGELPDFQIYKPNKQGQPATNKYKIKINEVVEQLKGTVANYDFVTAEGTQHRGDTLHFSAPSARLMGERYAAAMQKMLNANTKESKAKNGGNK